MAIAVKLRYFPFPHSKTAVTRPDIAEATSALD